MRLTRIVAISGAVIAAIAVAAATGLGGKFPGSTSAPAAQQPVTLPHAPAAYIGIYTRQAPQSYAGVTAFTAATGIRPSIVLYYSGWPEPFQSHFAATVVRHNAVPLVQMDPTGASIAAIAAGRYDDYLRSFASAVKAFDSRVILSFGHEMNGVWYSWGYRHVPPAVFVAAWRRIVTVFRQQGADKVTWLWTVNVIHERGDIPSPAPWWPGRSYVNWVGIDGYYYKPSWKFASLFGPTIKEVRKLTLDPILISETAVAPSAGQPAKITDLIAGIRAYGLVGFVWFDVNKKRDWSLSSPAAIAAFARGARMFRRPVP